MLIDCVFQPWICRVVVLGDGRLMNLAQSLKFGGGGIGERGSNFFFVKFDKFIYLNQENPVCDLLPRFCRPFCSQPFIDRGIGRFILNALFPGRLNHR